MGKIKEGTRCWLFIRTDKSDSVDEKKPYECIDVSGKFYTFAMIIKGKPDRNVRLCLRGYDLKDRFRGVI